MPETLVSVICLCYNHEKFVEEAILSVLNQTYRNVEIIIVDDASSDSSVAVIEQLIKAHPEITFIKNESNVGNCAAFNIGFNRSSGDYVIDFATDDFLMPTRIEEGIKSLQSAGNEYGVQFSDAALINADGEKLGLHSERYPNSTIPSGDIYVELVKRYFICAPSMLIKREVLERINGYDESLAYEDFDFWIRSARHYKYIYLPKVLVKRRVLHNSMRSKQFKRGSQQLKSTFRVCQKILELNNSPEENIALRQRLRYELKVCLKLFEMKLAWSYFKLLLSV